MLLPRSLGLHLRIWYEASTLGGTRNLFFEDCYVQRHTSNRSIFGDLHSPAFRCRLKHIARYWPVHLSCRTDPDSVPCRTRSRRMRQWRPDEYRHYFGLGFDQSQAEGAVYWAGQRRLYDRGCLWGCSCGLDNAHFGMGKLRITMFPYPDLADSFSLVAFNVLGPGPGSTDIGAVVVPGHTSSIGPRPIEGARLAAQPRSGRLCRSSDPGEFIVSLFMKRLTVRLFLSSSFCPAWRRHASSSGLSCCPWSSLPSSS